MALSADELDRQACIAMICSAEDRGAPLTVLARRTGRIGLELRRLIGDLAFVIEQYEPRRGTVYYWNGRRRGDEE